MRRSNRDPAIHRLYCRKSWRDRRAAQLTNEPLCRYCEAIGLTVAATVADHIIPHRGDLDLFAGELQSLCSTCHSAVKQREEHGGAGYSPAAGTDGWPLDPKHPANARRRDAK